MKLYIATTNKHKIEEFQALLLPAGVELLEHPDYASYQVEENGMTFEENAALKAVELSKHCDSYVIADDSGLEVAILHGDPGIFSARYSGEGATDESNRVLLLKNMEGKTYRSARFVCAIALAKGGEIVELFRGICKGNVALAAKGNNGFGYDSIFLVSANITMAELSDDDKNMISHRRRAVDAFCEYLSANGFM